MRKREKINHTSLKNKKLSFLGTSLILHAENKQTYKKPIAAAVAGVLSFSFGLFSMDAIALEEAAL